MDITGPLTPIENLQLADRVHQAITRAIVSGQLAPGEPLRDRALAEQLGVSRTPVKEALVRLETTGLVVTQGRSWHVSPFEVEDLVELSELRHLLEPVGLDRLEKDRDERTADELAHFFDGFSAPIPVERYEEYFATDHAFHKRIVACAKNRRIQYFYSVVEQQIDRGRHFLSTSKSGRVEATLEEHLAICKAIADRDFDTAREALHHHLDMGAELMTEFIEERNRSVQDEQGH
jgi:DNA-binding GntR family transcriptional regulator